MWVCSVTLNAFAERSGWRARTGVKGLDDEDFGVLIKRGKQGRVLFWIDVKEVGGVIPHLQCSAVQHQPISSELRGRGRGQSLSTAKESSRSDTATENKWEREAVVVRASGLVPNSSLCISPLSLFPQTGRLCNLWFSLLDPRCLYALPSFYSWFPFVCFSFLCGWSERLFFPNTYTPFCPPPLHHIPWASVHLAGKSSRSVSVRADVITTDSLGFALRQFQVFLFLHSSLSSDYSSW